MVNFIDVAIRAAQAGGTILRAGRERAMEVQAKGSRTSLVTWADGQSQAAIVRVVRDAYPDHAIVGEEGTVGDPTARHVWIVDPLDGTTNYAHGVPFYCVSVALREGPDVVAAAIYDPYHDELFAAERGAGATCNGAAIHVSGTAELAQALIVTELQSDDPVVIRPYVERVARFHNAARGVRAPGSPALCMCYVACGRLDAHCERGTYPWDVAAGMLLIDEAGGRVTGFDQRPIPLDRRADVLATNGRIHPALAELVQAEL